MNLRLYFLFLMLLKGIREGAESKIPYNDPRGLGASPKSFSERVGVFSVC